MLKMYTDTDTDFNPALAAEYGYKLIPMPYSVDAKTTYPYVDFEDQKYVWDSEIKYFVPN